MQRVGTAQKNTASLMFPECGMAWSERAASIDPGYHAQRSFVQVINGSLTGWTVCL